MKPPDKNPPEHRPPIDSEGETIGPASPPDDIANDATVFPAAPSAKQNAEKNATEPDHDATRIAEVGVRTSAGKIEDRIGSYKIRRAIASGGMGTVYEAVQDNPRRVVALKVIKHGIASPEALKRFEYETRILARLRHPNIAQIYEAGVHDTDAGDGGAPFFAMEYVVGAKQLDEYVIQKGLSTRDRLELFEQICEAVHHGHQKGVIHRDLKPANILVDSQGMPKIIDFGVARATDSDVSAATIQTEVGQLIGTVQYMSPEQIAADPNDIDTRSDVYALGVILYQLLTNRMPYDLAQLPVYEATRIISRDEPKRPSTFQSYLKGDLETIVLHALEKDRDRRYQSAAELGKDIERFRHHEPIIARPASVTYLMQKFARRNRALVGGAAAVFAVLVLGIIGTTVGLVQARSARDDARIEANIANATADFFEKSFDSLNRRDSQFEDKDPKVSELLHDAAGRIDIELRDEPTVQLRMRRSVGNAYRALTMYDDAEVQLRKSLALQRELAPEGDAATAQTLEDLASILWYQDRLSQAEVFFREALEMRLKLFGEEHADVAQSQNYLAACLAKAGQLAEAESLYRDALQTRQRLFGRSDELVARSENNLAMCLMKSGEYEEAEQLLRRAVDTVRLHRGDDHIDVAGGLSNLARCLVEQERFDEAEPLFRDALRLKRNEYLAGHASIAITLHHLADLLHTLGRSAESIDLCLEARQIRREKLGDVHASTVETTMLLADALTATQRFDEADVLLSECLDVYAESPGALRQTLLRLATSKERQNQMDEAAAYRVRLDQLPRR